ncbi:MAG TPA: hypothetical protein VIF57_16360 [Polyangia bacterium]|jgi:hypothetical protein
MVVRSVWRQLALGLAAVGCATAVSSNRSAFHAPARGPGTIAPPPSGPRPDWVRAFQAPAVERVLSLPKN